jgi:hypothetical protein
MTDQHWEVINFLRDYYNEFQIAPAVRVLTKAIGKKLGPEKGTSQYLYDLFPYGPAKQACKIAGLPKPTAAYKETANAMRSIGVGAGCESSLRLGRRFFPVGLMPDT